MANASLIDTLIGNFGYLAVFAFVGIESLGIPIPGETMLVAASIYAASTGKLALAAVIGAAIAGAIIGDNIGFAIGYRGGYKLLRRHGRRLHVDESRLKLGRFLFDRYGGKVVFFGRFVSVLRTYAAFLAGTSHMNWRRFFFFNAAGGIVWSTVYGLAGYYGRDAFKRLSTPLDIALAAVAITGIVLAVRFTRANAARLEKLAERAYPGPLED